MSREMAADPHTHSAGRALAAMAIFVVMLFAALALWTAIPLSWIWIGSKVAETQFPATGPYMVVAVGIILSILLTSWLLTRLNLLYVRSPAQTGWPRSLRLDGACAAHLGARRTPRV